MALEAMRETGWWGQVQRNEQEREREIEGPPAWLERWSREGAISPPQYHASVSNKVVIVHNNEPKPLQHFGCLLGITTKINLYARTNS